MSSFYSSRDPGNGFDHGPLMPGYVQCDDDGLFYREEEAVSMSQMDHFQRSHFFSAKDGANPVSASEACQPSPDLSLGLIA